MTLLWSTLDTEMLWLSSGWEWETFGKFYLMLRFPCGSVMKPSPWWIERGQKPWPEPQRFSLASEINSRACFVCKQPLFTLIWIKSGLTLLLLILHMNVWEPGAVFFLFVSSLCERLSQQQPEAQQTQNLRTINKMLRQTDERREERMWPHKS